MNTRKFRKTALLLAVSLLLTGCGFSGKEVLLSNEHELSEDAKAVSSLTSGKQEWTGTGLCIPEDSSAYEDEEISAGAALLFNLDEPEVLYAKNVYQEMNPASLTTLFTAYVVLQNKNLSDTVTVQADALASLAHTSTVGLKAGDQVTVEQLLHGMLLCSGVDAANVLAIETAGDKASFVRMMNRAAKECGCADTQFQNPNGLTEQGHYTTAYDIYLIVRKLMEDQRFLDIISSGTYKAVYRNADGDRCEEIYTSTVQYTEGGVSGIGSVQIVGGKTGTTSSAGHCLALICTGSSGKRYLAVVMKAKSHDSLYEQIEHIVMKIEK